MYGQTSTSEQQQRLALMKSQKELADLKKQNAKKPKAQKWASQLKKDGTIRDSLKLNNNIDSRFLDQMRTDGLRQPGEASAWRGLIDDQITRQAGDSQVQLQNSQNQQLDNLAMRGGVSSGAAERMAQAGVGQNLQNQQNIFSNRLQADLQDEQMRQTGLANLGQAEMGFGGAQNQLDTQNLQSAQQELFQKRAFDTNVYNQQMQAWGAAKTAKAAPSGGGGKK